MKPTIQVISDIGGDDRIPHSFIRVIHPDGSSTEYGLGPANAHTLAGPGKIYETGVPGSPAHEFTVAGEVTPLSNAQYTDLMSNINRDINSPPHYNLGAYSFSDIQGAQNCTTWVVDIFKETGLPTQFGITQEGTVWTPYAQAISLYVDNLLSGDQPNFQVVINLSPQINSDGSKTYSLPDGTKTVISADGTQIHMDFDGGGSLFKSLNRSEVTTEDGTKVVQIKDANGNWLEPHTYAPGHVEDVNDIYDPDNDGVGTFNGNNFESADFDSIADSDDVKGLNWGEDVQLTPDEAELTQAFWQSDEGSAFLSVVNTDQPKGEAELRLEAETFQAFKESLDIPEGVTSLAITPTDSGFRVTGEDQNGDPVEHTTEKDPSGNATTHTKFADGSEKSTGTFGTTEVDKDGNVSITTKSGTTINQDSQGNFVTRAPVGVDAAGNPQYDITIGTKTENGGWNQETTHPDGSKDYEYEGGGTSVSADGATTTVNLDNGTTIVQTDAGYTVTNNNGDVIARGTDAYDYSLDEQGNQEWNHKDGSQTKVSADGTTTIRLPDGTTLNQSDDHVIWSKPDGSKIVSILDANGEWQTKDYKAGYVEDINDPFDPDGDGVGDWDGTLEGFENADFDAIIEGTELEGLDWGEDASTDAVISGQQMQAAFNFINALEGGNDYAQVVAGLSFIAQFDGANTALDGFVGSDGYGQTLAVYNFYNALDSGDTASIVSSGAALYNAYNTAAPIPYLAYAGAVMQALDGDIEGAAVSALQVYLAGLGPWGWVAAIAISVLGIGDPPPPHAWSEFTVNDDGSITFDVDSNSSGDVLEDTVTEYSEAMVDVILGAQDYLQSHNLDIVQKYIPDFGIKEGDLYIEYNSGGGRLRTEIEGDPLLWMHNSITMQTMFASGLTSFNPSPYAGDTDWSHTISGTGVFAGGGNVGGNRGTVYAKDSDIELLAAKPPRVVVKQLEEVSKTWQVDKGLFGGEAGKLLAIGIAAGVVDFDGLLAADILEQDPQSIRDSEAFAEILAGIDGDVIVAGVGVLDLDGHTPRDPTEFIPDLHTDFVSYYVPDPEDLVAEGADIDSTGLNGTVGANTPVNFDPDDIHDLAQETAPAPVADQVQEVEEEQEEEERENSSDVDESSEQSTDFTGSDSAGPSNASGPDQSDSGGATTPVQPNAPTQSILGRADRLNTVEDRDLYTDIETLLGNDQQGTEFVGLGTVKYGVVSLDASGEIYFVPDDDYAGDAAGFEYVVKDSDGVEEHIWVTVDVANVNDRPDAVDDHFTVVEDTEVNLSKVLLNDTDADGDQLHIASFGQPQHGSISINRDGDFIFTPEQDYIGPVELMYVVEDESGARSVARTSINYTAGENDEPTVKNEYFSDGVEEAAYTLDVQSLLANDYDPEGGEIALGAIRMQNGETAVYDAETGKITVTPDENFTGEAVLEYEVMDADGGMTVATAGIYFQNTYDPFSTDDQTTRIDEDTATIFTAEYLTAAAENPDGETRITAVRMADESAGRVVLLPDGNVQFFPAPNFVGDTAFEVRLSNGNERIVSRIDITVDPVNDAPIAEDDIFDGLEDLAYELNVSDLLLNDLDLEGDAFEFVGVELADPAQGSLSFDPKTGEIKLTPAEDVNGAISLKYTIREAGTGLESTANANINFAAVDDTASLTDKTFSSNEDEVQIFAADALLDVLEDVDGESLNISAVRLSDPAAGTVELLSGNQIKFTPAKEYAGEVSFEYDVTDGTTPLTVTANLSVLAQNDAPTLGDDQFDDALEDTQFHFNLSELIENDSDIEGDAFEITSIELVDPAAGSVSWDPVTGEVSVTPAADFSGEAALKYTVRESESSIESSANITVVFAPENDTANITDKQFSLLEDETRLFTKDALLDVLVDVDGDVLSIENPVLSDPEAGTLKVTEEGHVLFTPTPEYSGEVSFTIDVIDPGSDTPITASIDLSIAKVNDAPVGESHRFEGVEETALTLSAAALLAGATDVEGDAFELTDVRLADATSGSLSWNLDSGEIMFTPAEDYFGEAKLEYVLTDERGAEQVNNATVVFAGTDDTAAITEKAFTISEDETTVFTAQALLDVLEDADGEALTIEAASLSDVAAGTISVIDGNVQFIPAKEFSGELSFDIEVTDGVTSQTISMGLAVENVNDAPDAADDVFEDAIEDAVYTLNVSDLLSNDSDAEGNAFDIVAVDVVDPSQGELSWDKESGEIVFTPADNFNGEARLSYTVRETDSGVENTANAGIIFAPVNDTAEISDKDYKDQQFNLFEDESKVFTKQALLGVTEDVDGETLNIVGVNIDPTQGSVEITENGNVRFIPAKDYVGEAVFDIEVDDSTGITTSAQMTVKLWPVNDDPNAKDDAYEMDEDTVLRIDGAEILSNDGDTESSADSLKIVGVWASSTGSAMYDAHADQLVFTPEENAFGDAWIDYIVEDESGGWDVARISVDIEGHDDPITAMDDTMVIDEDAHTVWSTEDFTANDLNPDLEQLTITNIDTSNIAHGTLQLKADGTIEYIPEAEYYGEQSFSYTIEDESGHSSQTEVSFVVEEVNDAPIVKTFDGEVLEDEWVSFNFDDLMQGAHDIEDDWMRIVGVRSEYGDVKIDEAAQTLSFKATENLNSLLYGGDVPLEYLVMDEVGAKTWADIDVNVVPVNDPPKAYDDVVLAWESGPGNYTNPILDDWLTYNDIEVDGEDVWVDTVTQGQSGSVSLNDSSQLIGYQAEAGFTGQDTFTYRVTDGIEGSNDWAKVTVQVMENHAPVASDFGLTAKEDTILRFEWDDIAENVFDEDLDFKELSEDLKVVSVGGASNGSVTLNPDGSISFDPTDNYNSVQHGGVATFDYTVEDIVGHQSTATASIVYTPVNDNPLGRSEVIGGAREDDGDFIFTAEQILGGDIDVDGDSLSIAGVWGAGHGSIYMDADGEVHYTPAANYNGRDSFTYRVVDGNNGYDDVTSYIQVAAVNDIPVVQYDSAEGDDDGNNFYTAAKLLGNDRDVDGDSLHITSVGDGGTLSNGGISVNNPSVGHHTIHYTVSDGHGGNVQSQLSLDIIHTNRPPVMSPIGWEAGRQRLWVNAWDAEDGTNNLHYELAKSQLPSGISAYGHHDASGSMYWDISGTDSNLSSGSYYTKNVTFSALAKDSEGAHASTSRTVSIKIWGTLREPGDGKPIVIDMNGDGINLMGYDESNAKFDWEADGDLDRTGWLSEGDGMLAYDHNSDGVISEESEISFVDYLEGAQTDLEGLAAFDTNQDGLFSSADEEWNAFGVWMDNGDALNQEGEFVTLDSVGVSSINLTSDGQEYDMNGNHVFGTTEVTFSDGSTREAADVMFAYEVNDEDEQTAEEEIALAAESEEVQEKRTDEDTDKEEVLDEVNADQATAEEVEAEDVSAAADSTTVSEADAGELSAEAEQAAAPVDVQAESSDSQATEQVEEENSATSDQNANSNTQANESATVALDVTAANEPVVVSVPIVMPSDSELDRMAQADAQQSASRPPESEVPSVDENSIPPPPSSESAVEEDDMIGVG